MHICVILKDKYIHDKTRKSIYLEQHTFPMLSMQMKKLQERSKTSTNKYAQSTSNFCKVKKENPRSTLWKELQSYLFPTSSPVTVCPSTIVNAPIPIEEMNNFVNNLLITCTIAPQSQIYLPGSTKFFSISVPVAVALIRHICAFSRAS